MVRSAVEFLVAVACMAATCMALAGSDPPPFPASLGAWAWWTFLVAVSAANVRLLMGLHNRVQRLHEAGRGVSPYQTNLLWCATAYVLGCFVPSRMDGMTNSLSAEASSLLFAAA